MQPECAEDSARYSTRGKVVVSAVLSGFQNFTLRFRHRRIAPGQ